ncbi:Mitochodrial transcription termination factor [Parasponia andersonii]|uniref:Mitochodrial transcription termination factor n=1 Tax=Parasponia andersonii TaxID=3476 RepID=A0A2P5DVR5_PARAD|nr:Mitochodrial transcription termination factor [Parasponia andersonii]
MSEISSSLTDSQNFTVSYLRNSCGLSQKSAISVSKKLLIENPEKADSVLELMRTHRLTQTHIRKIIGTRPELLLADLEHILRPNMELLKSLGLSGAGLGKLLIREPRLLHRDVGDTVDFFKAQGFSDKQIAMMIIKRPALLLLNANKIFKPKLDFFKSVGLTDEDVAKILSRCPYILQRSLVNHIMLCAEVLKRVLGTNDDVLKVIKACNGIFEYNLEKILVPNILIFKSYGVPKPVILRSFVPRPRTLLLRPQHVTEVLDEVVKLGFDPNTTLFILAFSSMALQSKTLWERKVEAYKSFGLSEDQVYSAFRMQPMCMLTSVKKIKKMMNFFMTQLILEPSVICRYPGLFLLSLEKRIIPRCSVLQLLMSTGFMKEDVKLFSYLIMTEEKFVKNLVWKYQNVLPDIVKAYKGKIEFQGFAGIM